jgi:hypothetical protein
MMLWVDAAFNWISRRIAIRWLSRVRGVGGERNSFYSRHRMCTEGWSVDDKSFWDRPRGDAYETYSPSLLLAACI